MYDDELGTWVEATVSLVSNPKDGLPVPFDESLFLALFNLALEANYQPPARFQFVPARVLKVMKLSPNPENYDRLIKGIRRLTAVKVVCKYVWFDTQHKRYLTEYRFGVLADGKMHRVKDFPGQKRSELPKGWIVFDPELYQQLTAGTLKPLDLDLFFSLKRPVARRMYRALDRFFYKQDPYENDLRSFACGNIGLPTWYDTGQLKAALAPGIEELVSHGYLERMDKARQYKKIKRGVWRICLARQKRPARSKVVVPPIKDGPLFQELIDHGVKQEVAVALVGEYDHDRIAHQIEYHDERMKRSRKTTNPAGLLVSAIQQNWDRPEGYKTKGERAASAKAERERRKKEHEAGERARRASEAFKAEYQQLIADYGDAYEAASEAEKVDIAEAVAVAAGGGNEKATASYRRLLRRSTCMYYERLKEYRRRHPK